MDCLSIRRCLENMSVSLSVRIYESINIEVDILMFIVIYIYNSVYKRRLRHINSSAIAPMHAKKIAVMKVSHMG